MDEAHAGDSGFGLPSEWAGTLYRAIFETANDAIIVADVLTRNLLEANPAAEKLLGRSREELLRLNQADLHAPDDVARERAGFQAVARVGGAVANDVWMVHADGTEIPVEISANVFEVGGRQFMLGIVHDLRETMRLHIESHHLVRTLSNFVPICAGCKRIRDTEDKWHPVEEFLKERTGAALSHGLCPVCVTEYEAEIDEVSRREPHPAP